MDTHRLRGKHLHLDCFAGIAGDMFLGALIDLGVPEGVVREGLSTLALPAPYTLTVGRARHLGIEGCDVKVHVPHRDHGHAHRSWREIRGLLEGSTLPEAVRRRAVDIFSRLAQAEGKVHGVDPERVEFHEVGAVDSLVDIVGAALALDHLCPARVTSRPIPLGRGFTRTSHGPLPVPAPAAVEVLAAVGASVEDGGVALELCTPTGAAIAASIVQAYTPLPAAPLLGCGYGAGDMTLPDRPNHLRVLIFEPAPADACEQEAVVVEANIDDMPHEWCGYLMERLFAAGARDVWYTPIVMKKGRPALTVSVLCAAAERERVGATLLGESSTIGLRHHPVGRQVLGRRSVELQTRYGTLTVKLALDGERVVNATPEYETCRAAAERSGVPLKEVYAEALAVFRSLAHPEGPG